MDEGGGQFLDFQKIPLASSIILYLCLIPGISFLHNCLLSRTRTIVLNINISRIVSEQEAQQKKYNQGAIHRKIDNQHEEQMQASEHIYLSLVDQLAQELKATSEQRQWSKCIFIHSSLCSCQITNNGKQGKIPTSVKQEMAITKSLTLFEAYLPNHV